MQYSNSPVSYHECSGGFKIHTIYTEITELLYISSGPFKFRETERCDCKMITLNFRGSDYSNPIKIDTVYIYIYIAGLIKFCGCILSTEISSFHYDNKSCTVFFTPTFS